MLVVPLYDPPAIIHHVAPLVEVKRRKRGGQDRDTRTRSRVPAWIYVGAILILTDDNGNERECHVIHVDYEREVYYCAEDQ